MSTPKQHHYVPKVYLKSFADEAGNLFAYNKLYRSCKKTNISNVCYALNYFTVSKEETQLIHKVEDINYIEKEVFRKQENAYRQLLHTIIDPPYTHEIAVGQAAQFMEVLINIKRRNPSMKQSLFLQITEYINSAEFQQHVAPAIEISRKIDTIDPEEYIRNYIATTTKDKDKLKDMYLARFLQASSETVTAIINTLLQFKWHIILAPVGSVFYTSDNPGFTFTGDNTLLNAGGLSESFVHVFPLTPTDCLMIGSSEIDKEYETNKTIHKIPVEGPVVNWINDFTFRIANNKVLGRDPFSL